LVKKAHAVRQDPAKTRPASILRHARSVILDHPVRVRVGKPGTTPRPSRRARPPRTR